MREQVTYVTQSKYFSPLFNAAIFDGPIRIYFAQHQEAQALKLYLNLQERFNDVRRQAAGIFKDRDHNIFVMLYPNEETFDGCFGEPRKMGAGAETAGPLSTSIISEHMGEDFVVGVRGPMEDAMFDDLCEEMDEIVRGRATI